MFKIFSPFKQIYKGISYYLNGLSWVRQHPGYGFLLFLPIIISFFTLIFSWTIFWKHSENLINMVLMDKPQAWWAISLYFIAKLIIYISIYFLSIVFCVLLANIISSPFYEIVSVAVEKNIREGKVEEISFWQSFKLIKEEIKKILFIFIVSIFFLFIPIINVVSIFISAFLIGWDFYDYPLTRRGWSFKKRLKFAIGDFWAVMGFGFFLIIPFVQVILMPLAISGGTMLCLDNIKKGDLNDY